MNGIIRKWVVVISVVLFLFYLLVLLNVTLFTHNPGSAAADETTDMKWYSSILWSLEYRSSSYNIRNFLGNMLLFLPFGFFVGLLTNRLGNKVRLGRLFLLIIASACFSLTIELLQHFVFYRIFDVDDILMNTLGAFIGLLVYMIWLAAVRRVPLFFRPINNGHH
ncbi:VanZ family protein [Bacillaceae bacterium SIJ1]|uniref:VanZ family protein n=1 Tax=Litoribacterium kuwaitense TaxID=1398745 RepID=UPI0013EC1B0A|nr:VanZ family protein [Litoribacterium kuwaitense]NGP45926.1 VanZ family protein [Litoribacterium kuwaitense]